MSPAAYGAGMTAEAAPGGVSVPRLAIGVALGILVAAAVIWAIWSASQPSELDCLIQQTDYTMGEITLAEMDPACRE